MQLKEKNPGSKKILLTGGTGYLGSHLVKSFLAKGDAVSVLKRESSKLDLLPVDHKNLQLINISKFEGGEFDVFVHAATAYGRKKESVKEIEQTNIDFPLSLLSKLSLENLHFINIGTSLPSNLNDYARTKNEFYERFRNEFKNIQYTHFSLEQFFGPEDGTFISFIINSLKTKNEIDLTPGEQKRDFIYYKDVIDVINFVIEKRSFGTFDLGTGKSFAIKEIVELIQTELQKADVKLNWGKVPYRENELMNSVADIGELLKLGWNPKFDFKKGLNDFLC